jgi:hypothetical protein
MRSSNVIPEEAKEHFWSVVRECVREFHSEQAQFLRGKLSRLRKKVADLPIQEMELFYHSEPFDVACRLAQRPLKVKDYLERYLTIRDAEDAE